MEEYLVYMATQYKHVLITKKSCYTPIYNNTIGRDIYIFLKSWLYRAISDAAETSHFIFKCTRSIFSMCTPFTCAWHTLRSGLQCSNPAVPMAYYKDLRNVLEWGIIISWGIPGTHPITGSEAGSTIAKTLHSGVMIGTSPLEKWVSTAARKCHVKKKKIVSSCNIFFFTWQSLTGHHNTPGVNVSDSCI